MVLYLDAAAISNQIKYYLTANWAIFLEMQFGFYTYVWLSNLLWVVVERAFTKNSRRAGRWLFGTSLWKIIKFLWLIKCSGAISRCHLQSVWKFAEISRKVSILIYLDILAENQIFLKILFFSNTDIHTLLRLYSLIEWLQSNQMHVTSF